MKFFARNGRNYLPIPIVFRGKEKIVYTPYFRRTLARFRPPGNKVLRQGNGFIDQGRIGIDEDVMVDVVSVFGHD
jgi:hypothetical protein